MRRYLLKPVLISCDFTTNANINFNHNLFENTQFLKFEDKKSLFILNGDLYEDYGNEFFLNLKESIYKFGFQKALQEIDGTFSLIYYDKMKELIYITRDHFGIYPCYYYIKDEIFLFSNDLKLFKNIDSFEKNIDLASVAMFFQHGFISHPNTIFQDCYKISPASFIKLDIKTKNIEEIIYWNIFDNFKRSKISLNEDELIHKSEKLLRNSLKKRIDKSMIPGSFLSGGYDSSAIVALFKSLNSTQNIHTFTIGFADSIYDESKDAAKIAEYLKSDHNEHIFTLKDIKDVLPLMTSVYSEPFGDKSAIASILVAKSSKNRVDYLFGGEGGDEVFISSGFIDKFEKLSSYPYFVKYMASLGLKLFSGVRYEKWSEILAQKEVSDIVSIKDIMMSDCEVKELVIGCKSIHKNYPTKKKLNNEKDFIQKVFPTMINTYVSNNLLTKIGSISLYYNLPIKTPFLDKELYEFLATVKSKQKYKDKIKKYILKKIVYRYIPKNLLDRPKQGFSVPVAKYLKSDLSYIIDKYLSKDKVQRYGILNYNEVKKIKEQFFSNNDYYSEQKLWNLLIFALWCEDWLLPSDINDNHIA
jgi:asparagine synthase (glutamine-hydrolysing)